jgi:ferredoxin-nitrate reductase
MVFLPFHWGDLYAPENAANYLTISAIGRVAKQPELKFCAVNLEKVAAPPGGTSRRPVPSQTGQAGSLSLRLVEDPVV